MRPAAASMDGQQEGDHHQAVAEIVEDDLPVQDTLGTDVAKDGTSGADTGNMPVADVMVLLQAMREEQLDSLKSIADGVQQLQSQVMVLGEFARNSEGRTSLVLDRLARIDARLDPIPMPMKSQTTVPPKSRQHQHQHQQSRTQPNIGAGMGGGVGTDGRARAMNAPQHSSAFGKAAPPPPPATVEDSGRVPTWQGRAEPEPARPHFMRNASPQQKPRASPAKPAPATAAATVVPGGGVTAGSAVAPGEASGGGKGEGVSPEEAARKEAKRLAFMEDRARIQARIAASKGGRAAQASSPKPTPKTTRQSTPADQDIKAQNPELFETPSAASGGEGGSFSGSPSFLDGVRGGAVGAGAGGGGADDEAEAWLEREREQRGKRERERREEKERVERQLAEAKKLREEEEARKVREAEEARAREKARREAEAKRQAKTRVLMSSLFDKGEEDDGNSLFGGLGGAALPVFHDDDNNGSRAHDTSLAEQPEEKPVAPASSVSEADDPPLSSGFGSGIGGVGGSLFAGIEEPSTGRGGIFDEVDTPGSPSGDPRSSPMGGLSSARQGSSNGGGSGLFPDEEPSLPESRVGAGDGGDGNVDAQPGGYSGLFDSSPPLEGSSSSLANNADAASTKATVTTLEGSATDIIGASSKATIATTTDGVPDEMDDFFSTLEAGSVSAASTGAATTTATRGSLFEHDDIGGAGDGDDDDIFSSAYAGVTAGTGGDSTQSGRGNKGALFDPSASQSAGTSLFDRMEFSIDAEDPDGGNVFGGGGVSGGGRGIGDASASFLSAMGEVDLMTPSGDGGVEGEVEGEADKEGMTEVSL
ncbi:unnamed protein product [Ectocarpus fasciculatus]